MEVTDAVGSDGKIVKVPKGPSCMRCDVVVKAYPGLTKSKFLALWRGNRIFRQAVKACMARLEGTNWLARADVLPRHQCLGKTKVGLRVETACRIFTEAQLTRVFKCGSAALKLKPLAKTKRLTCEHGVVPTEDLFVARDDTMPRRAVMFTEETFDFTEDKMAMYIRSGQADDQHKNLCDETMGKLPISIKDIEKTMSVQELQAAAQAVHSQRNLGLARHTVAESGQGATIADVDADLADLPASLRKQLGGGEHTDITSATRGRQRRKGANGADEEDGAEMAPPTTVPRAKLARISASPRLNLSVTNAGGASPVADARAAKAARTAFQPTMLEDPLSQSAINRRAGSRASASVRNGSPDRCSAVGDTEGDVKPAEEGTVYFAYDKLQNGELKGQTINGVRRSVFSLEVR